MHKHTREEIIDLCNKKHHYFYNYDKLIYTGYHNNVIVTCPIHGDFDMRPHNHLILKQNCPICAEEKRKSNTQDFISKSRKIFGDFYNYDKVDYERNHTNVIITCPIHGDFPIQPANHLSGKGCPHCKASKLEKDIKKLLDNEKIIFSYDKHHIFLENLRLDFFLPNHNIAIECQGIQHFKPTDFANKGEEWAQEEFKKTLKRDERKRQLCKEHNIKLLYYSNLKIDYPYQVYTNKTDLLNEIKKHMEKT